MTKNHAIGILTAGFLTAVPAVQAATIYGLTSTAQLIRFDSATPGTLQSTQTITGFTGTLVDIDFYPVNGLLYAFNNNGLGYRINLADAVASLVITPGSGLVGSVTDVDFNPQADRARVYTTGGANENFRLVPDQITAPSPAGTVGTVVVDGNFSDAAAVLVGSAYTNNFDGSTGTTLYSINTTADALVQHSTVGADPAGSFNTITQVGGSGLGIAVGSAVGFDIVGTDTFGYLSNGNALYTVSLVGGGATSLGTIGGTGLISIAAVPEPTTAALASLGLLGLTLRRRRS